MALAVNRTGVIFKKCDTSNHRPETVRRCASGTCQHTCPPDTLEKCKHAWTLRYWVNGKQAREVVQGRDAQRAGCLWSGRKLAQDFQLKLTVDKRSGDITFADHGRPASRTLARLPSRSSRVCLLTAARPLPERVPHPRPARVRRHDALQVANDRDGVMDLLVVTMKHLSNTPRQQARYVIVGTVDEAVKAGRLSEHRLDGIELADNGRYSRKSFVFPTYEQVKFVADGGVNPDTSAPLAVRDCACGSCAAVAFASKRRSPCARRTS